MTTRELPRENNMDLKFMQVNVSKRVTRIIKTGLEIRTD